MGKVMPIQDLPGLWAQVLKSKKYIILASNEKKSLRKWAFVYKSIVSYLCMLFFLKEDSEFEAKMSNVMPIQDWPV